VLLETSTRSCRPVEHGIAVGLPPFAARKLCRRLGGLPLAGFLEGRSVNFGTLVVRADGTAGEDEEDRSGAQPEPVT